jgi:hypothetical protein
LTPEEFIAAGRLIYGRSWQVPLMRALGVNERTMRRWYSGRNPIPDAVAANIRTLVAIATKKQSSE